MDLIKGVALIIRGETTGYGMREDVRERRVEVDNNRDVSVHSGKVPLRGQRQKRQRKTEEW